MISLGVIGNGVSVAFTDRFDEVGDDMGCALFSQAATRRPTAIFAPNQVHGSKVLSPGFGHGDLAAGCDLDLGGEGDGIFLPAGSSVAGAVRTADCLPLVISNRRGDVVILHVGWRGLAAGIVENGISRLGARGLHAVIGPHISDCCYEFRGPERYVVEKKVGLGAFREDKLSLDNGVRTILYSFGMDRVETIPVCTSCDSGFHSHRRDADKGRQLTLAMAGS